MEQDRGMNQTVLTPPVDGLMGEGGSLRGDVGDTERLWSRGAGGTGPDRSFGIDTGPEPVKSLAAIAGHPLHPSVVPLPIGSFVGAWVCDVAFSRTGDAFWARAAHHLTQAGIATGLVAGSLGAMDFMGREQIRSHGSAWVHAGGNLAAIGLAATTLAMRGRRRGGGMQSGALAVSTTIVAMLAVTGWLGGELSYRHRIGVIPS